MSIFLFISLRTGFSINLPSITTKPVFELLNSSNIFFALVISSFGGVNTSFKI